MEQKPKSCFLTHFSKIMNIEKNGYELLKQIDEYVTITQQARNNYENQQERIRVKLFELLFNFTVSKIYRLRLLCSRRYRKVRIGVSSGIRSLIKAMLPKRRIIATRTACFPSMDRCGRPTAVSNKSVELSPIRRESGRPCCFSWCNDTQSDRATVSTPLLTPTKKKNTIDWCTS